MRGADGDYRVPGPSNSVSGHTCAWGGCLLSGRTCTWGGCDRMSVALRQYVGRM